MALFNKMSTYSTYVLQGKLGGGMSFDVKIGLTRKIYYIKI